MIHPTPNRLVRHWDSAFRQQILDVTQAESEPEVEPNCLLNDLGRETIPAVADFQHAPDYRANSRTASPPRRDNAPPPLQIARGDVVEHEHAILEVALGEDLLDGGLAAAQKVEGGVKLVLVD